uniref:Retrotransposon gag domain-containing protein n=1 Tax=Sinocyclocheilus grahami TaxID=75366 RepID=A0A672RZP7_SINGR
MFLPCLGEPAMPFDMWLRMFNNYLLVINATGDAWPDIRKRATLLQCLGTEGQQIFYALPETGDTYASAVSALDKHFTPKVNVVVERYAFRKRAQFPHETIAQYVAALHALAATCGFEDKSDNMIHLRNQTRLWSPTATLCHTSMSFSPACEVLLFSLVLTWPRRTTRCHFTRTVETLRPSLHTRAYLDFAGFHMAWHQLRQPFKR